MDHHHPAMVEALRGHWPLIEPGTPLAEAQRVAADIEHLQHRESGNHHRALQLQVQQQAQGGDVMIPPLENIKFALAVGAVVLGLSSSHLLDGPSDVEAARDTEASLNDALEQAQAERPELWAAEQKQRARVAAQIVAEGARQ